MCAPTHYSIVFLALVLGSDALNCRTDGGPKENELKSVYSNCLKRQTQQGRNTSRSRNYGDDDWREPRGHNQRDRSQMSKWDRDGRRDDRNRDDNLDDRLEMGGRDTRDYRTSDRDDGMGNRDDRWNRDDRNRDDRMSNDDDKMGNRDDRTYNRDDRMGYSRNDKYGTRDERMSNDRMERHGFGRQQVSRRDEVAPSYDYESEFTPAYNMYHSSTQLPHRFKREIRLGVSSGQRSRYNPNPSSPRPSRYEDSFKNDERNSSENTSSKILEKNKACALHCFMESLEMTGDNGMPDKYLVTHVITKDVRNEDLRDFLQESIEECFHILGNENTEDKCEFSKNLLLCLSEKGRANCDDWKDDIQF